MKLRRCCLLLVILLFTVHYAQSQFATCTNSETCKPFKDCEEIRKLTDKGRLTPQETAYVRSKQCNSLNRVAYVCCPNAGANSNVTPANLNTQSKLPKPPVCGTSASDRIVGGEETNLDEFPWLALIQYLKPNNVIKAHCGGSLITKRYVLTAAHCDRKVPKSWKLTQVRLGEYNQETNPDCFDYVNERICADPYIEIAITNIVIHNEYNPDLTNQPNDIALLRMARDVTFTDWIKPICLPEATLRTIEFAGHELEVAGFGKTEFENSNSIKLKVGVNAYTQDACKRAFPTLPLTNKQICAGGEAGKDSCNGDSGGPLMKLGQYPNHNSPYYMLIGVVSFGPRNCGTKDVPGVYTKVSEYVDWINQNIY